ncbi:Predicted house-cleaning noncanonical NTP pyrophosphatase, all-alpha NTP-PPase (MazG) superfamily [Thalassobacillus cyri]|uniref:Predicted house-cleaning noncanonical NTP pyrophosphatase, all-alpha NTP-PPase (MazG) superfamily n=1 Tax=Thalassobacillus cyri TaxID=571932 RepID=A0A1H3ZIN8_9BACI|nr:nucleoside triphosphate pyrophosphohydrolase [Thalassobacillus cyri]SEA23580.1 Predicted house-cleaning noncanonical NTP pyrophosphatase, all-alpha NTP-PPase (MazG) superfamily [Thalassobacillus cyri]
MPLYNKLVRDKIPLIIESNGKQYNARTLNEKDYRQALKSKLVEETEEYLQAEKDSEAIEELADILEVIKNIAAMHKSDIGEVENVREKKEKECGSFQDRILLIEVED